MAGHSAGVDGGPAFSIPAKKMAMWLFIIADTATFAACLVAYGSTRNGYSELAPSLPQHHQRRSDDFHSRHQQLDYALRVRAAKAGDKAGAFRWTLITAALGIAFALLHIREWFALIDEGMTLFKNPWGSGLFGASFFSITGLHLTHVTGGVIALIAVGTPLQGGPL